MDLWLLKRIGENDGEGFRATMGDASPQTSSAMYASCGHQYQGIGHPSEDIQPQETWSEWGVQNSFMNATTPHNAKPALYNDPKEMDSRPLGSSMQDLREKPTRDLPTGLMSTQLQKAGDVVPDDALQGTPANSSRTEPQDESSCKSHSEIIASRHCTYITKGPTTPSKGA